MRQPPPVKIFHRSPCTGAAPGALPHRPRTAAPAPQPFASGCTAAGRRPGRTAVERRRRTILATRTFRHLHDPLHDPRLRTRSAPFSTRRAREALASFSARIRPPPPPRGGRMEHARGRGGRTSNPEIECSQSSPPRRPDACISLRIRDVRRVRPQGDPLESGSKSPVATTLAVRLRCGEAPSPATLLGSRRSRTVDRPVRCWIVRPG